MSIRRRLQATRWGISAAAVFMLLATGCGPADIDRTYGKRRGAEGGTSVNGTGVLAGMFEAAGHRVITWRRLSPKLEQFNVIVWVPDSFRTADGRAARVSGGLAVERAGRMLVYVGRDYDAAITYWRKVQPQTPPEQTMEVARRLATVQCSSTPAEPSCRRRSPSIGSRCAAKPRGGQCSRWRVPGARALTVAVWRWSWGAL